MSTYTITTQKIVPLWVAWFGNDSMRTGTGPTEAAAIADLLANYKAPWGDE